MNGRRPLTVISGTGGDSLRRSGSAPRLRPGEYPLWSELAIPLRAQASFRRRAHEHRLGVDAFLSIAIEYLQVAEVVGDDRLAALERQAHRELEVPAVALASELRGWQKLLEGFTQPPGDELPSVCVPLRLVARIAPPARFAAIASATEIDERLFVSALVLERAAARLGMTVDFWALRAVSQL